MKFSKLAKLYKQLEETSSHNKMQELLADFLKKTPAKLLDKVAYLTLGQIDSAYSDTVIGMAENMVMQSIAKASTQDLFKVKKTYQKTGDLGNTAEKCAKGRGVLVTELFETLHEIAAYSGKGSQDKKISSLARLLRKTSPLESRYLVRIVLGQLRLGAGDKTLLHALARAYASEKEATVLEHTYNSIPDVGAIAQTLARKGLRGVASMDIALGVPLQSMLCQRIDNLATIKKKMDFPVIVEEKYDGERVQVHKKGKDVQLFSRRLDNITYQFPDLVKAVKKAVLARECILDAEIMPVDKKGGYKSFQTLMQRRRKHDIEEYIKNVPVALFIFDVLYYKKSLLKESYEKRYKILEKIVKPTRNVKLTLRKECNDLACIGALFNNVVEKGGEGVIIKDRNGPYKAGVRGWHWIKWKPEYAKGMRDTFDVVVIGAYHGRGKRAGTYGALLCAVYNEDDDTFETFCKVGSGFSDKQLEQLPGKFRKRKNKPPRAVVTKQMEPDVWFTINTVIEVAGAHITTSPSHTSGLALRFPRFLSWREKKPTQATTKKEIEAMR